MLLFFALINAADPFDQLRQERAQRIELAYDARIVIAHRRLAAYCKIQAAPLAYKHLGTFNDALVPLRAMAAQCAKPKRAKQAKRAPLQVLATMKDPTSETAAAAFSVAETTVDVLGLADALWGDALAQALATRADDATLARIARHMGYGARPEPTTYEVGMAFTAFHGESVSERRQAVARFVATVLPVPRSLAAIEADVAQVKGTPIFDDDAGKISREALIFRARAMSALTLPIFEALAIVHDVRAATPIAFTIGNGETWWGKRFNKWLTAELALNSSKGAPVEQVLVAISAPLYFVPRLIDARVEAAAALDHTQRVNLRRAALKMLAALDERPQWRWIAASVCSTLLFDLEHRSLLEQSIEGDDNAARIAGFAKDVPGLWKAFERAPFSYAGFDWLIRFAKEGLVPKIDAIMAMDRAIAKMTAKHALTVFEYARYLAEEGENAHGVLILANYLQTKPEDVTGANIRAQYARFLQRLGQHKEALEIAEEAANASGSAYTRAVVAETLQALGRNKEAVEAITELRRRYSHAAWILRYDIAIMRANDNEGQLVRDVALANQWLTVSDWTFDVGRALTKSYCRDGTSSAVRVFKALATAGISIGAQRVLWQIFENECEGVLPIEVLVETMKTSGLLEPLPGTLDTHYVLKRALSQPAADAWLEAHVGKKTNPLLAPLLFAYKDDDQLWTLVEPQGAGDEASATWLFRAATLLRSPDPTRAAAIDAFLNANPKNLYADLINYMRDVDADASFARFAASDADRKCEASYYASLKALAKGDVQAAHTWLQLSLQTAASKNLEWQLSYLSVQGLVQKNKTLSALTVDDFR